MTRPETLEALVKVLGGHDLCGSEISEFQGGYWATFACGATVQVGEAFADAHRAHLATALLDAIDAGQVPGLVTTEQADRLEKGDK